MLLSVFLCNINYSCGKSVTLRNLSTQIGWEEKRKSKLNWMGNVLNKWKRSRILEKQLNLNCWAKVFDKMARNSYFWNRCGSLRMFLLPILPVFVNFPKNKKSTKREKAKCNNLGAFQKICLFSRIMSFQRRAMISWTNIYLFSNFTFFFVSVCGWRKQKMNK